MRQDTHCERRPFPRHAPLIGLLLIYAAIELFLFRYHTFPAATHETDGIGYMTMAQSSGVPVDPVHGPLYALAIRCVEGLGVSPFSAAKIVSLFSGWLFILVSFVILSSFAAPKEALLGTFLVACNYVTLIRSVTIMSDMMAATLFLGSLAFLLVPRHQQASQFLVAGLLAGLAYLTRYVSIILFVIPMLLGMLALMRGKDRLRSCARVAAFPVGFLLITLPWFALLYRLKGNPFWNENHVVVAIWMLDPEAGMNNWPALQERYRNVYEVIADNPALFVKKYLRTLYSFPGAAAGMISNVGAFGGVGFFLWLSRLRRSKLLFLAVSVCYGLAVCLASLIDRYLLPLLPLIAAFVAAGLLAIPTHIASTGLSARFARGLGQLPLQSCVVGAVVLMQTLLLIPQIPAFFGDRAPEFQGAAHWLAAHREEGVSAMASKPHIAFFGGVRDISFRYDVRLQDAGLDALPEILAREMPTYVIYDERIAAEDFPRFRTLLDPQRNPFPELLTCVYEITAPMKLVIYRYHGKGRQAARTQPAQVGRVAQQSLVWKRV